MTDETSAKASVGPAGEEAPQPTVLKGTSVCQGLALGPIHRLDYDLAGVSARRVPRDQVEEELNRFHKALSDSRDQLLELKAHLQDKVPADHARILDTHIVYLKDSVFLSDVENLILAEQMSLESAIAKVISDFDRIFRLVESDLLRERAVDLRDVGIRVLRNLERAAGDVEELVLPVNYVLVARELSIVDMFNLDGEHVQGILTEAGSLTSHAAILARSMRIPTLTGVEDLLDKVEEGDFVILDATEGVVRVKPDPILRAQYKEAQEEQHPESLRNERPDWAQWPARLASGEVLELAAACGNLPDVERAITLGMEGIGLYRTELLYLVGRKAPSLDSLVSHYDCVLEQAHGQPVTFRLLDIDSSLEVDYLHEEREPNPGLGRMGVRLLLARDAVLRTQLQALLRTKTDSKLRIAVPKIVDCGELRRVKEILFEERFALKKTGVRFHEKIEVGAVIETPASALGVRDLIDEVDFLSISLDSLQQYLLAADRDNKDIAPFFERVHPFVVRVIRDIVAACTERERPLDAFGFTAVSAETLPFLIGAGLRRFSIAPVVLQRFLTQMAKIGLTDAEKAAKIATRVSCPQELSSVLPPGFTR